MALGGEMRPTWRRSSSPLSVVRFVVNIDEKLGLRFLLARLLSPPPSWLVCFTSIPSGSPVSVARWKRSYAASMLRSLSCITTGFSFLLVLAAAAADDDDDDDDDDVRRVDSLIFLIRLPSWLARLGGTSCCKSEFRFLAAALSSSSSPSLGSSVVSGFCGALDFFPLL